VNALVVEGREANDNLVFVVAGFVPAI